VVTLAGVRRASRSVARARVQKGVGLAQDTGNAMQVSCGAARHCGASATVGQSRALRRERRCAMPGYLVCVKGQFN